MKNGFFKTVMLIDDSEVDIFINRKVLELSHAAEKIICLQSAREALEFLKSHSGDEENLPGVIFLDIRMPEMDGFEFLEEFQQMPGEVRRKIKIYILTSSLNENDRKRARDNKYVCDYMVKPISEEMLEKLRP